MKLNFLFLILATVVASISANNYADTTNAQRMARGLPPLPPARRATPTGVAKRSRPSSSHHGCNTGSLQCCDSLKDGNLLEDLIGILLPGQIGLGCSPLSIIGIGQTTCTQQTACCHGSRHTNTFGDVSLGCSPIKIL